MYLYSYIITNYSQICLMWPFKGTVKYGHIRQMVLNTGLIDMKCTLKGNKNYGHILHNTSYCLIEVVTKAGLTVLIKDRIVKILDLSMTSLQLAFSKIFSSDFTYTY